MATLFFTPPREHFFRPLTHDNRELCAAVLRALHERVHGVNADYAEALTREVVLEVVGRLLADPALRALAFEPMSLYTTLESCCKLAIFLRRWRHGLGWGGAEGS